MEGKVCRSDVVVDMVRSPSVSKVSGVTQAAHSVVAVLCQ